MTRGFGLDAIVSVASSGSVVLVQLLFTISLMRSWYIAKHQSDSNMSKPIQCVSLSIFIYLAMTFIIWIIEEFIYRLHPDENMWVIWYWLFFIFIAISLMLFYAFMLLRLYYTFHGSHLAISRTMIKIHLIPIIQVLLLSPMAVLARMMGYTWLYFLLLVILMTVYGIGTLHLIYVFYAKLFKFTCEMKKSYTPHHIPAASSYAPSFVAGSSPSASPRASAAPSLNVKQLDYLETIRKQTLLGFIILLMLVMDIAVVIIYQMNHNLMFWHIAWATTMNVATFCIYLGFVDNKPKYHCMCSACDFCCKLLCDNI
eukprot:319564_1